MLVALALGGCGLTANPQAALVAARPEAAAVKKGIDITVAEYKLEAPLAIASPREASPLAPAEWIVCLRGHVKKTQVLTVATFFRGDERVASREALPPDRCGQEVFTPLKSK